MPLDNAAVGSPSVGIGPPTLSVRRRVDRDVWRDLSIAIALMTLFMLAARIFLGRGISIGHVMALATLPVWIGHIVRSTQGRLVVLLSLVALANGVWLTAYLSTTHSISELEFVTNIAELLSVVLILGVFLWACTLVRTWIVASAVGFGLVFSAVTRPALFLENPWKYALGLPIAALLLALAMGFRRRLAELLVLVFLAGASALMDSRSFFGVFAIGILLTVWQMIPASSRKRTTAVEVLLTVTGLALAVYVVGTTLLLEATSERPLKRDRSCSKSAQDPSSSAADPRWPRRPRCSSISRWASAPAPSSRRQSSSL